MNLLFRIDSTSVLDRLGWTLLHSLWQFTLIGLLLAVILSVLRRQSSDMRYLAACAALLAMVGSSLATFAWLPPSELKSSIPRANMQTSPTALASASFVTSGAIDSNAMLSPGMDEPELGFVERDLDQVLGASWSAWSKVFGPLLPWSATAWLVGVSLLSLWNLGGWIGVQHVRRSGAKPAGAEWQAAGRALIARMNIRQSVDILQSTVVRTPIVIGWLKPIVLLPVSLLGEMSAEQVEAILAHELAHIRRHDYLVNLSQIVIETLLFYHPATWWVSRQIRVEREHCCDAAAATACAGGALALSEALTLIAASRLFAQSALAATGPSRGSTLTRVERLLNPTNEPVRASKGASAALVMLLLSISSTIAMSQMATAEPPEEKATLTATAEPEQKPQQNAEQKAEAKPEPKAAPQKAAPAPAAAVNGVILLSGGEGPAPDEDPQMAIFVMKPDGTELRELATTADHSQLETPRWSHDGKRVLFTGTGGARGGRDFYVVNADGKQLTWLGAHGHADWSPDDKNILFDVYSPARGSDDAGNRFKWGIRGARNAAEQGRGSFVQEIDGTEDAKISTGLCPRWSPDGTKVAVTDHKTLRVIDLASDKERVLFENPFEYIFAGYNWSPDGKWLALSVKTSPTSHRKLLLVSAEGEKKGLKLVQTAGQGGSITFSPDGKRLIFADDYKLRTIDIDGDGKAQIIAGKRGRAKDPHWSADGKWIVFAGDRPRAAEAPPAEAPAP